MAATLRSASTQPYRGKHMRTIFIFDLDGTVIDSAHRTPNHPDGTLENRENIFKDTLLPLARIWKRALAFGHYVFVATARGMEQDDYDYLADNELEFNSIVCRRTQADNHRTDMDLKVKGLRKLFNLRQFEDCPKIMFDDAPKVRHAIRTELEIPCLDSIIVNRRLENATF
jgi:FMN phosphatase YigB (HAD superfamily)